MAAPKGHSLRLVNDLVGSSPHDLGDEIWHESLIDAIRVEAECIAEHASSLAWHVDRDESLQRLIVEMTAALRKPGDTYLAPDGVRYSLVETAEPAETAEEATFAVMAAAATIEEVLSFEDLPLGSSASRRAVVRWSDGSTGEALRWYDDEILVCEGDLIGKTREQLRSLHFRRDRDWLQS